MVLSTGVNLLAFNLRAEERHDKAHVAFEVAGMPQGKGRARGTIRRARDGRQWIGHYTPAATRSYEGMIRYAAQQSMAGREPISGAISVELTAIFEVPKSASHKRRAIALAGDERPAKRPDLDNIVKAFTDAMNTVVFQDDAQIVHIDCAKIYGAKPSVKVVVTSI